MDLIKKISADIQRYGLLRQAATVIVGLSGGADSVALLTALRSLDYRCIAAHCNFHLRGEESDRDASHAENIAAGFGIEFRKIDFNVDEYISEQTRSVSVEMACRKLRYDWFEKLLLEYEAEAIAVAHNSDDNSETLFLNLFRGTGISGLRGMLPKNNRHIIRPMLHCSRREIEEYLADNGIDYVTDSTNLQSIYHRNAVRNEILPNIRNYFPNLDKGIAETLGNMLETDEFLIDILSEKKACYTDGSGDILLKSLIEKEKHAPLLLYEWLSPLGFNRLQTESMIASANSSGRIFESGEIKFINDRGVLKRLKSTLDYSFKELFEITEHPVRDFSPVRDPWTAYFDSRILSEGELTVDTWREGDRIKPFGMKGTKKLSDIFNDAKIGGDIKSMLPILRFGEEIVWIPGLRASRLYTVTAETSKYITVRYVGPKLF